VLLAESPLDVADGSLVGCLWRGVVLLLAIAVDEGSDPALLARVSPWPTVALSHTVQYLSKVQAYRLHRVQVTVGLCAVTGYGELYGGWSWVGEPIMSLQVMCAAKWGHFRDFGRHAAMDDRLSTPSDLQAIGRREGETRQRHSTTPPTELCGSIPQLDVLSLASCFQPHFCGAESSINRPYSPRLPLVQ
jgi:hypothetical protein